jgi:hypothetical protein
MKVIEMTFDETQMDEGVFAISIVESPAIKSNFVALSTERIHLKQVGDKRQLIGLVMQPEQRILRVDGEGKPYYIYFTAQTIEKVAKTFMKRNNHHNATLEHEVSVDKVYVSQSWIVEDPKTDKTALYGIEAKAGSWAVVMSVENDEIWDEWVKTGKVLGFSLEGGFVSGKEEMEPAKLVQGKVSYAPPKFKGVITSNKN